MLKKRSFKEKGKQGSEGRLQEWSSEQETLHEP